MTSVNEALAAADDLESITYEQLWELNKIRELESNDPTQ